MTLPVPKARQGCASAAHARAPAQERGIATRLGGRTTKASGQSVEKGDVRVVGLVRVEAKCTTRKSFSVTRAMIEKVEAAALGAGEVPYIEVEMLDGQGRPVQRVAVLPTWALDHLIAQEDHG